MAKISRFGGPSSTDANPGDVVLDATDKLSALHPDEQGAAPLYGEGDGKSWLVRDPGAPDGVARDDDGEPKRGEHGSVVEGGEDSSRGNSSSRSSEKQPSTDVTNSDGDRKPAPETESLSDPDGSPERSTARSGAKSTTSRAQK